MIILKKSFISHFSLRKWLIINTIIITLLANAHLTLAHQTPNTVVLLDVSPKQVAVELQLPIGELELAFGQNLSKNREQIIPKMGSQIKEYLLAHIHPMVAKDQPWMVEIKDLALQKGEQTYSGPFQEIIVHLLLTPPEGASTRNFIFDYDVIMHQLVTHSALVLLRSDWAAGKAHTEPTEIGVIRVDTKTTLIYPLTINLAEGNFWKGFTGMFALGEEHIKEGIDHLMFLLVLLLPIPLSFSKKRWESPRSFRLSLIQIIKIVSAFTLGHSLTLLMGAMAWVVLPSKWIEILIAFSILVSAVHAIRPIFAGKEMFISLGFGLIHGLAFANTLIDLNLDNQSIILSILGFNLGIEVMQLWIILMCIPWLILLSRTAYYSIFRITCAILASIAAFAWMLERYSQKGNIISDLISKSMTYSNQALIVLIAVSFLLFWQDRNKILA